jgi:hypothetical protein
MRPRVAKLETPKVKPSVTPAAERHKEIRAEQLTPAVESDETPCAVSDKAVRDLVDRILPRDDDEAAKAFISLIHLIAYNDDRLNRDSITIYACDAAYQRTMAYSDVAGKFFDESTAEFRSSAASHA